MKSLHLNFRKATFNDADSIWNLLQQAILRRKMDGSQQWQEGYPNLQTVKSDIEKEVGYVLADDEKVVGYAAVIFNDEPAYETIDGKWLSDGKFAVVHRVAVSDDYLGKGLAKQIFLFIEKLVETNGISSIKVDTNFDNPAMLHIFEKLGYSFCGKVLLRGNERLAFEKLLISRNN